MKSSLKLSKELEKRGFKKPSHVKYDLDGNLERNFKKELDRGECFQYDIIYELCLKYGKELFGEEDVKIENNLGVIIAGNAWEIVTMEIFLKLQQGKDQDTIEDYIIKNLVI